MRIFWALPAPPLAACVMSYPAILCRRRRGPVLPLPFLAVEYLLVAVLTSRSSMRVNEQLDVSSIHYLDINHADIVARIDLTEWETNPESTRYLTFLKGRVGRKVSDFFMDFLGAAEGLDTKAQNRGLLQAVDDYCAEAQLDKTNVRTIASRFIPTAKISCRRVRR